MEGYIRFNYPSESSFPVRGIDISNHQGSIQWDHIDSSSIFFAFIKATEGGDFKDQSFYKNWTSARQNKIVVSAYHFFTFCRSGSEQAFNFMESVPNESDMLPPAIDLEYSGNCKLIKSKEELLRDIDDFINIIETEYNRKIIIYVTESFYNDYLVGLYPDNPLWVRDVFRQPKIKDTHKWTFWQYTDKGRIDGIKTKVDLNVFNGTYNDFKNLISTRCLSNDSI